MITEEDYNGLTIVKDDNFCHFGYVFDKFHGEGVYIGFDPTTGYQYQFGDKEITAEGFKPLKSIIRLQSFKFTPEVLEELHSTYPPGYTEE